MISLAASHWKLDLATAARQLTEDIEPGLVNTHVHTATICEAVNALARSARTADPGRLKPVLAKWRLSAPTDDRWAERLGRFVGVCHKSEIERVFRPNFRGHPNSGKFQIFVGKGWADVLVIPFYDLPGRIQGFWMGGREGNQLFAPAPGRSRELAAETGLGFLEAILGEPDPEFGDTVFIANDALMAAAVHDKHFRQSSQALPLLACHARERLWARLDNHMLAGRKVIFWSETITRELLRQAKATDGYVTTGDGDPGTVQLARYAPRIWLRQLCDSAVHWTEAVGRLVSGMPDPEVESTVLFLDLEADERQRLMSAVSPEIRERLNRVFGRGGCRTVQVFPNTVLEVNGHWYSVLPTDQRRRFITDAPFRIEQVIQCGNASFYRVTAVFRDQPVTFVTPVKEFDNDPLGRVREEVRRAGVGLTTYSRMWNDRVVSVATQFLQPEFVTGAGHCGWNEARGAWVFEQFEITARGRVTEETALLASSRLRPTLNLAPPADLHPADVGLLSRDTPENSVVWATAACVLSNLIAPVANQPTSGIGLSGDGAIFLGRAAATQLGCVEAAAFGPSSSGPVPGGHAASLEEASGWPVILHRQSNTRGYHLSAWLARRDHRNSLIDLEETAADVLGLRGGWHVIRNAASFISVTEYRRALGALVPAYLKWFAENGLKLKPGSLGEAVLASLTEWFAHLGGDPKVVKSAQRSVQFDHGGKAEDVVERFGELLSRLVVSDELPIKYDGKGKGPFLTYTATGNLFVPKAALNRLLAARHAPALDAPAMTQAMTEDGILVQELDFGNPPQPGWEISRTWWNDMYGQ